MLDLAADVSRAHKWMTTALGLAADAGPPQVATRRAQRGHSGRVLSRRPRPLGPPGDHGEIITVAGRWQCVVCRRHVKISRGWRQWRQVPCRRTQRSCPTSGPALPDAEVPLGRTAHLLATAGGRTRCLQCGQSSLARWRSKLGVLCPPAAAPVEVGLQEAELPMPVPAPPAAAAPAEVGLQEAVLPMPAPAPPAAAPVEVGLQEAELSMLAPAPVVRRRRRRIDVDTTLSSHLIIVAEGWLQCDRPGCGRRFHARDRSRFAWCLGDGAPGQPTAAS